MPDNYQEIEKNGTIIENKGEIHCPECGAESLIQEGRCTTCYECGWSKCSI